MSHLPRSSASGSFGARRKLLRAKQYGVNDAVAERSNLAKRESVSPGPEDEVLNDDERKFLYWQTRYPDKEARNKIRCETIFVVSVIAICLALLFIVWHGGSVRALVDTCQPNCQLPTLKKYSYLLISGILGGALFGLKYLYKVVARGYWNQDRAIWRYTSPVLSGGLALASGALTDAGVFGFATSYASGGSSYVALGFIVGYFADSASRKLQEVAETLFGHPAVKPRKN